MFHHSWLNSKKAVSAGKTSSDTTVSQKEQSVNNYSMQEGGENSLENEKQFSISNDKAKQWNNGSCGS